MKPPAFAYAKPETLDEALNLLAQDGDARILAGGQSLVPILNFRLAAPTTLIDINRLPGLDRVDISPDGLRLGALVRWRMLEAPAIATANPAIALAVPHIAHYQIRNRGTVGGSCAHADPAAEFPAIAVLCDAEFVVRCRTGTRVVGADAFFCGALATALEPDEIMTEIRFPPWPRSRAAGFAELAPRAGDFAYAGIAAFLGCDAAGVCVEAGIVAFGGPDRPQRLRRAEGALARRPLEDGTIRAAAEIAQDEVMTHTDMHATADYRSALVAVLTERALTDARHRASGAAV